MITTSIEVIIEREFDKFYREARYADIEFSQELKDMLLSLEDTVSENCSSDYTTEYESAYEEGYDSGHDNGYEVGYEEGVTAGYQEGFEEGIEEAGRDQPVKGECTCTP